MNALLYIRKYIFRLNQSEFARAVGVGQSSVSRWDRGAAPSLPEMQRIREAAMRRGIDWDDRWFFRPPDSGETEAAIAG
jgi:transcriptional regulator with XRE-family HTH domain